LFGLHWKKFLYKFGNNIDLEELLQKKGKIEDMDLKSIKNRGIACYYIS